MEENDVFRSRIERFGFETFTKLKTELFEWEQRMDQLAIQRQYVKVYNSIEVEVEEMMVKYK